MNVNDYTNNDLLKIIGIDIDIDPYYKPSVYLINSKIDSLIVKMKQENKLNFVSFFENIRLKLLSINKEDEEEEEEEEEDEEDEEEEEEEEEEEDEEEQQTKDVNDFLNRDNTRNVTQILNIDTRFRSEYYNTLSTSFTFELPEIQKNVVSIRLASIEMPITYYSISNTLGNNSMLIVSDDLSYNATDTINDINDLSYNFIIDTSKFPYDCREVDEGFAQSVKKKCWLTHLPDGNYDLALSNISNTENIINDALSLSIPGAIDDKGRFAKFTDPSNNHWLNNYSQDISAVSCDLKYSIESISKKSSFSSVYDSSTYKSVNPKKISGLMFNVDSKGNLDTNTNIQTKLGWTLGFRGAEYILGDKESSNMIDVSTNVASVSEGIPFLSGSRYCFFSLNDYANNSRSSFLVAYNNSSMSDNILARISLTGSTNNLGSRDSGFTHTSNRTREYFSPVDIKRLTINLYDEYGRIIDLNNMDWSFTLAIEKKLN